MTFPGRPRFDPRTCPHRRATPKGGERVVHRPMTGVGITLRAMDQRGYCPDCGATLTRETDPVPFGPWRALPGTSSGGPERDSAA